MPGRVRWVERRILAPIVLLAVLTTTAAAQAADLDGGGSTLPLEVHGFISQGAIKTTGNNYFVPNSERGSFDFNEAGINFTSQLTERLRIGIQLFAYDQGSLGNYAVGGDWYYIDYRLRDWLGIRAGRLKMPLGLYGDISDIDAARVSVLLPTSLYPYTNRDFLLAQNGAEIYGFIPLRRMGGLDYRLFGGSIAVALPAQVAASEQVDIPWVAGGRVMWETPIEGLRAGVTGVVLKDETAVSMLPAPYPPEVNYTEVLYAGVGSIEYAAHNLLLQAEYSQERSVATISSDPALLPLGASVSEGKYILGAYRVTSWFEPAVYYSVYYPHRSLRSGSANIQDDLAATLRFDINNFWLVKLEAHYMHGTEQAAGATPTSPEDWGIFLIKTTAYF